MTGRNTIDFVSRYCRNSQHTDCAGAWAGLGLEVQVACSCGCHKRGILSMSKLTLKQPSEQLRQKLDNIVKHFQNCVTLIDEAFALGLKEGFSVKEIGQMIRERLTRLGYDPCSIRERYLPQQKICPRL